MRLDPRLGLAAAALLLAGAGGAALAHPHPDGDGGEKTVKRFVIIEDGKGDEHHAKGDHVRRVEIIRDGEHHAAGHGPRVRRFEMRGHGAPVDCDGGDRVVEENGEEDGKKTKVVICTKGRPTAATAERIEKALARIRANDELSDEQKARIETALRSAMERARSAR
ncbi:MAG TPA: hypothetical protein VFP12_12135 [Allosphingosinicella sp.]|nr:hypothetical protein [Allosphingosinicella sp.]